MRRARSGGPVRVACGAAGGAARGQLRQADGAGAQQGWREPSGQAQERRRLGRRWVVRGRRRRKERRARRARGHAAAGSAAWGSKRAQGGGQASGAGGSCWAVRELERERARNDAQKLAMCAGIRRPK
jgi:hypothetical protein